MMLEYRFLDKNPDHPPMLLEMLFELKGKRVVVMASSADHGTALAMDSAGVCYDVMQSHLQVITICPVLLPFPSSDDYWQLSGHALIKRTVELYNRQESGQAGYC
jgi:hypothetical protein